MAKLTITIEENPSDDGSKIVSAVNVNYDPQNHPSGLLAALAEPIKGTIVDFINAAYGEPESFFETSNREEAEAAKTIFQAGGNLNQSH